MTSEKMLLLAARLQSIKSVSRHDVPGEPQSSTMAHAFTDLEQSFRNFVEVLLPKLLDPSTNADEATDILLDIGEEFRHILYHIRDVKYFGYIFPITEGDN